MSKYNFALIVFSTVILSGCAWLAGKVLGESFVEQIMYDAKTKETVECVAHMGRGAPSKEEINKMNTCMTDYAEKGYLPYGDIPEDEKRGMICARREMIHSSWNDVRFSISPKEQRLTFEYANDKGQVSWQSLQFSEMRDGRYLVSTTVDGEDFRPVLDHIQKNCNLVFGFVVTL